jgi:hypothetical protein
MVLGHHLFTLYDTHLDSTTTALGALHTQHCTSIAVWTQGLTGNYHCGHQRQLILKGSEAATLREILRKY